MKKLTVALITIILMVTMVLTACSGKRSTTDTQANASSSDSVAAKTQADSQENGEDYDPYAAENR